MSGFPSRGGLNQRAHLLGGQQDQVQIRIDPSSKYDVDAEVEDLMRGVGRLKEMAGVIHEETQIQGRIVNNLEDLMHRAQDGMQRAMKRLGKVYKQGGSNHFLYLVVFAIVLFFVIYMLAKVYRVGRTLLG